MKELIFRPNPKHPAVVYPASTVVSHVGALFQGAAYHKKFFFIGRISGFYFFRNRLCSLCGNRADGTERCYRFKELELRYQGKSDA